VAWRSRPAIAGRQLVGYPQGAGASDWPLRVILRKPEPSEQRPKDRSLEAVHLAREASGESGINDCGTDTNGKKRTGTNGTAK